MNAVWLVATGIAVVGLVVLERRPSPWRRWVKALASSGFVAVALASGALDSDYGRAVLGALLLGWLGDLLLTVDSRAGFLGGLVAFLLGHVAFAVAFVVRGVRWVPAAGVLVVVVGVAMIVWRWLAGHVDRAMTGPVLAYIAVISLMVVAAVGTAGHAFDLRIVLGAALFYVSDLFVARQRFISPGHINRLLGLPLYYAGQVLLALSVSG